MGTQAEAHAPGADLRVQGLERRRRVRHRRAAFLATQWDAERFGAIDPDDFFDFQVTRPTVTLTEGRTREIAWPELDASERAPAGRGTATSCS